MSELGQTINGIRTDKLEREHCHFEYACCVATDDPLRKITPKNFRALSVEFPELFARETKEQERSEATDVD